MPQSTMLNKWSPHPKRKKKKTQLSTPPLNYYTETKSIQIETTLKYYYLLNPQLTKDCSVAKKVISVQCDYVSKMQLALKKKRRKNTMSSRIPNKMKQ